MVVADSLTRTPLSSASVFNGKGIFLGISSSDGRIGFAAPSDYPLTVRYIGYHEKSVPHPGVDTVFLTENVAELPEVVVETKQKMMLHVLAYVREYSTLSSYTDTVTMFREKMVDFMLPNDSKPGYKGWKFPRVLNSRSYYQFTNAAGLDSVSNQCAHHFTWSDWIGILPPIRLPALLAGGDATCDTVSGKHVPSEIWRKAEGRVAIDVNVMADTAARKWVPGFASFLDNENIDFEQFRLRLHYSDVIGDELLPLDLSGYSFNIDSRGRGRGMFQFQRHDQPFFVTTYAEVYILDKEYISVKEAKKWEKRKFDSDAIEIYEPMEAPELQPATLALIERVNNVDKEQVRLSQTPDHRLMRKVRKHNFNIGTRALSLLKQLTGITYYKSHKNFERRWKQSRKEYRNRSASQREAE